MPWMIKSFQQLTTNELYTILKERMTVFVVEQKCPYFELDDYDQAAYHLFYQNGNEIIAYSRIFPHNTIYEEASIGRVLVKKEYRGRHLAKELFTRALDFLENELEAKKIKIQAQQYVEHFYASFGFRAISEVYLEDGIPHVDMIRS
ncbi:GNAT family N-acetyltransferase [Bacillaceae bacterium Marseille-Q3522]|nr:GNAT family N-acetyltransferase [Bacillaceae bacterium Marseille-Q3522]